MRCIVLSSVACLTALVIRYSTHALYCTVICGLSDSVSYPVFNACAVLYCHLRPVWRYHIYIHYLTNVTIFGKKVSEHKMHFSTSCIRNISHSKQKLTVAFRHFVIAPKNDKARGCGGVDERIQNNDTRTKSPRSASIFQFNSSYHLATRKMKARGTRQGFRYDFSGALWP
jgi:hypothetical protein